MKAKLKSSPLFIFTAALFLCTALALAIVPHVGGFGAASRQLAVAEETTNLQLVDTGSIKVPLGLSIDPSGDQAWVLGTTTEGKFLLASIDVKTKGVISQTELALQPGSGLFCSLASNDQFVAIGWQEQIVIYNKQTREARMVNLPKAKWTVNPNLIPVDNLQPSENQVINFNITDVLIQKGFIWVAREYANSLTTVALDTGAVEEHHLPTSFGAPKEISDDGSDSLWLTCGLANEKSPVMDSPISNDRIAKYSLANNSANVYPVVAGHIIKNPEGGIFVSGPDGINAVDVDNAGTIKAIKQHAPERLGDRDAMLMMPTGEVSVFNQGGILKLDRAGRRAHLASFPQKKKEKPAMPIGDTADFSKATTGDIQLEVQPYLKDGAVSSDGSVWAVVPNYGKIGIATP